MPRFESTILNDFFSPTNSHTHNGVNSTKVSYSDLLDTPGYASTTEAGIIKVGNNLSIDENGVLSATGGSGGGKEVQISNDEPTENTVELWVDTDAEPSQSNIEVITGDTLPIGSIIDYNGTTVPNGWETIANPDYSTSEVLTGEYWIDGKPIYRKVLTPTNLSTGATVLNYGVNNVELFISITGCYKRSDGILQNILNLPGDVASIGVWTLTINDINTTNNTITIEVGSSFTTANNTKITNGYIVLEYTKTTD